MTTSELRSFGRIRAGTVGVPIGLYVLPSQLTPDLTAVTGAGVRVFLEEDADDAEGELWNASFSMQDDSSLLVTHTLGADEIPREPTRLYLYPELTVTGFTSPLRTPDPFVLEVFANNEAP